MALITTQNAPLGIINMVEDDSYIYLGTQAYTKDTLTPVFGVTCGASQAYAHAALRPARFCCLPINTAADFQSWYDSTLADPGGLVANHSFIESSTSKYFMSGAPDGWNTSNNNTYYIQTDLTGRYTARYNLGTSVFFGFVPVGWDASQSFMLGLMNSGSTNVPVANSMWKWPATPGAGTSIYSDSTGYVYRSTLLSENATYWFIGVGRLVSGDASRIGILAVAKSGLTTTVINASTGISSTFPKLFPSHSYAHTSDSKYSYIATANGTAPYYTVKYQQYSESGLTQSIGNCTIDWGLDSDAVFSAAAKSSFAHTLRTWIVHTTTDDYVYFALYETGSTTTETTSNLKMYGFKITVGTPTTLVYKETIAIGTAHGHIRNVFPIKDDWTTLAVMTFSGATLYTFDDTNGYSEGVTIPYNIASSSVSTASTTGAFGVDMEGRIWVMDAGGIGAGIRLYSPTVATTITLTFASSSYNYSGTVINSSFNLSAYNASGSRIATDVQVVFDSPNCTFSDDTTTKTITTSSGGETSTNIKITAAGQVRAVANIAV